MTPPSYRLPLRPLLRALDTSGLGLAKRTGMDQAQVVRWGRYGLTPQQADELACKVANLHPIDVWGWQWLVHTERGMGPTPGTGHTLRLARA